MIPRLYERIEYIFTTTAPTWTSIGSLRDALSCVETSTINAEWELTMEYPMNGLHAEDVQIMRIIYTTQLFYVYRITKNAARHTMTVYCRHISYLLSFNNAFPFSATGCDVATFLKKANPRQTIFQFATDITDTADVNLMAINVGPSTLRDYMLNTEYGMVKYYGGEWVFDDLKCSLMARKGTTKDICIQYGVDLIDAKQDEAIGDIVTHIIPYAYIATTLSESSTFTNRVYEQDSYAYLSGTMYTAKNTYPKGQASVSVSPHLYVFTNNSSSDASALVTESSWFAGTPTVYKLPGADDMPFQRVVPVNLLDDKSVDPAAIAEASATLGSSLESTTITIGYVSDDGSTDNRTRSIYYNLYYTLSLAGIRVHYDALRTLATKYVNAHPVTFPVDITVQSVPASLSGVQLGDTITVKYPDYGISTEAEITSMEYDVLREQIVSYVLGKGRTSFAETMLHQDNKIENLSGLVTANNPLKGT